MAVSAVSSFVPVEGSPCPQHQRPLIQPDMQFSRLRLSEPLHQQACAGTAAGGGVLGLAVKLPRESPSALRREQPRGPSSERLPVGRGVTARPLPWPPGSRRLVPVLWAAPPPGAAAPAFGPRLLRGRSAQDRPPRGSPGALRGCPRLSRLPPRGAPGAGRPSVPLPGTGLPRPSSGSALPHVSSEATPGFAARCDLRGGGTAVPRRGTRRVGLPLTPPPSYPGALADLPGPDLHRRVTRYPGHTDVGHLWKLFGGGRLGGGDAGGSDVLRLANRPAFLYPKDSEEKRLLDAMLLAVPR